jgi:uncharacterized protein (TIGR03435 family)
MMRPCFCIALLCAVVAMVDSPDAQSADRQAFEVASVKRNVSDGGSSTQRTANGFTARNVPLSVLIEWAYRMPDYRVEGGATWMQTERFDINARAEGAADDATVRRMLQTLLKDRFRLVVRMENRDREHLALRLARTDGRLGPRLERLGDSCTPERFQEVRQRKTPKTPDGAQIASGACMTPAIITAMVATAMRSMVDDRTGLTGAWAYHLFYDPRSLTPSAGDVSAASDPNLPAFTVALEEQLGLRVERTRGPVETLVIESVELPTED